MSAMRVIPHPDPVEREVVRVLAEMVCAWECTRDWGAISRYPAVCALLPWWDDGDRALGLEWLAERAGSIWACRWPGPRMRERLDGWGDGE